MELTQVGRLRPGQTVILKKYDGQFNVLAKVVLIAEPGSDGGRKSVEDIIKAEGRGTICFAAKVYQRHSVVVLVVRSTGAKEYLRPHLGTISLTDDGGAQESLFDLASPLPNPRECKTEQKQDDPTPSPSTATPAPDPAPKPTPAPAPTPNPSPAIPRKPATPEQIELAVKLMHARPDYEFEHAVNSVKKVMG